jgi:hypothetical protein
MSTEMCSKAGFAGNPNVALKPKKKTQPRRAQGTRRKKYFFALLGGQQAKRLPACGNLNITK